MADLFADDGVIEAPFAAQGPLPARITGREAIRETHLTADPEVVVVELTTVGRVTGTGEPFEVPCVQVFRIRDGRIVLFRDYADMGSLPGEGRGI